jgi:hypothetical protein
MYVVWQASVGFRTGTESLVNWRRRLAITKFSAFCVDRRFIVFLTAVLHRLLIAGLKLCRSDIEPRPIYVRSVVVTVTPSQVFPGVVRPSPVTISAIHLIPIPSSIQIDTASLHK